MASIMGVEPRHGGSFAMLALELVRDEIEDSVPVRRMPRLMVPELTRRGASSRVSSWSETRRKQLNFIVRAKLLLCW
jgi:hypothetical protein